MKRFIVITISILLAGLIGTPLVAQPGPGGDGGPGFGPPRGMGGMFGGPHLGMLLHQLDLTDSQQSAIREIMQSSRDELRPLMEALQESRAALDQSMLDGTFDDQALAQVVSNEKALTEAQAQLQYKIYNVLTDEQRAQLKTRFEELQQRRESMREGTGPGPGW